MAKEYIERGALIDKISKLKTGGIFTEVFKKVVLEIISNQPTADVQEVRNGKWIKSKNERKCSLCGYFYFTNTDTFNFCPHCGAKMDER